MFKAVFLAKRRPGMTFDDFMNYYETNHSKLGVKVLPKAKRYFRRYLRPVATALGEPSAEAEYDVITECWFEDKATFESTMVAIAEPDTIAMLAEDEMKFIDRSKNRMMIVEEHESKLPNA